MYRVPRSGPITLLFHFKFTIFNYLQIVWLLKEVFVNVWSSLKDANSCYHRWLFAVWTKNRSETELFETVSVTIILSP